MYSYTFVDPDPQVNIHISINENGFLTHGICIFNLFIRVGKETFDTLCIIVLYIPPIMWISYLSLSL